MESGFQAIVAASATLLGLVLVALVFAYRSAITLIEKIGDFRHFAKWAWSAGFCCFLYFSSCFLVAFRLMEDETSRTILAVIIAAFSIALAAFHVLETRWLHNMGRARWSEFRPIFWIQTTVVVVVFAFFELLTWRAVLQGTTAGLEKAMFTALTYTLFFAAFRAVMLVGLTFWSITLLQADAEEA